MPHPVVLKLLGRRSLLMNVVTLPGPEGRVHFGAVAGIDGVDGRKIEARLVGPREIYRFTGVEGAVEADVLAECYSHRIDPFVDGTHSVGEIIESSYVNKFEVCKLLAAYLDASVVELVPPDAIRQNARLALRMGHARRRYACDPYWDTERHGRHPDDA